MTAYRDADYVSRPAQLRFGKHGIDARKPSASQYLRVRNHVTPADAKELTQACQVESIQFLYMSLVDCNLYSTKGSEENHGALGMGVRGQNRLTESSGFFNDV